jgi:transketolase
MRNAFAQELHRLAGEDDRIVLLSGDIGNNLFNAFKADYPARFLNCGAAEADMTGVAAGMALCGLRPVTYTIAAFNPGRCAEQIRLDVALHRLPVVIIGVGGGLSYSALGPTHHALEDVAWMRAIPDMTVVCPGDAVETRLALRAALAHDRPVYMRLGKKNEPVVHQSEPEFSLGKGIVLRESRDVCLLSVGTMLPVAVAVAEELAREGVACGVVSLHTIKPLDEDLLAKLCAQAPILAVLEEHHPAGGAWSAVAEWLVEQGKQKTTLLRFGTPDAFFTEGGGQGWARGRMGLTAGNVLATIRKKFRTL